jgi:hypothetical protein
MKFSRRAFGLRIGMATVVAALLGAAVGGSETGARADAGPTAPHVCTTVGPGPDTLPGISIADPACDFNGATYAGTFFTPLKNPAGAASTVYSGLLPDSPAGGQPGGESAYRIEVPPNWNGTLVMFAHGYRGTGTTVYVDNPDLRSYFVDHGYAWAASSYNENGYDVGSGVVDTHDLLRAFTSLTGASAPKSVIMSGLSMGGEITAVEVEYYRNTYVGAMPYCGVLAANDLFDYFLGANVTAAALTGTSISYPASLAAGAAYAPAYDGTVVGEMPALGITSSGGSFSTSLTATGQQWADAVEQLSGGTRPGFASALSYWDSFGFAPLTNIPFLFGLYPGLTGGTEGYAAGNVAGNTTTEYGLSSRPGRPSPAEVALNAGVLRVARTAPVSYDPTATQLPDVAGDPGIPVLSIHGLGDLFVPFSMDQRYDQLMVSQGQGKLFVGRAIREVPHCGYTASELSSGFSALVDWIHTGQRPAGDDILNPAVVASPNFGCRFTDPTPGAHPFFVGRACPPGDAGRPTRS